MPTKLWPRRRASSCASMTTLMAFSVKRSNMARTTMRLPAPRAARQRRWTAADREAGREAAAPSRRPAGAIPLKARMAGCCFCCRRLLQRAAPTGPARTLLLVTACILFPANRTNRRTRKWLAGAEVVDRMMHATHPQPAWPAGGLPAHNPIPLQFPCYRCTQPETSEAHAPHASGWSRPAAAPTPAAATKDAAAFRPRVLGSPAQATTHGTCA